MFCSFIGYGVQEVEVVTGPTQWNDSASWEVQVVTGPSQWNDNASWEVEVVTGPTQWMSFDRLS